MSKANAKLKIKKVAKRASFKDVMYIRSVHDDVKQEFYDKADKLNMKRSELFTIMVKNVKIER